MEYAFTNARHSLAHNAVPSAFRTPQSPASAMRVLGLCGSLRRESRSLALLQATQLLAAGRMDFTIHEGLGEMPLFNPDLEANPPASVLKLWHAISWAEAVVIVSPEYAHGVTGTIKNTLDWLVGYIPFTNKPVAVINPSHRAVHADESLREILQTMSAQFIADACLRIPVTHCNLDAGELAAANEIAALINSALNALERVQSRTESPH